MKSAFTFSPSAAPGNAKPTAMPPRHARDGLLRHGLHHADAEGELVYRAGAARDFVAEIHLILCVQRSRGESEKCARQQRDETVEEGRGIAMAGHGGLPMLLRSSEKSR
jgi:hypothetical protein